MARGTNTDRPHISPVHTLTEPETIPRNARRLLHVQQMHRTVKTSCVCRSNNNNNKRQAAAATYVPNGHGTDAYCILDKGQGGAGLSCGGPWKKTLSPEEWTRRARAKAWTPRGHTILQCGGSGTGVPI